MDIRFHSQEKAAFRLGIFPTQTVVAGVRSIRLHCPSTPDKLCNEELRNEMVIPFGTMHVNVAMTLSKVL